MENLDELSVLDYARSQGIATDHLKHDPSGLLSQIRDSQLESPFFSVADLESSIAKLEASAAAALTTTTTNQKLELGKDGAKFLSSVLKEVSSLQAGDTLIAKDLDSFAFPRYSPSHDLKVEVPVLTFEKEGAREVFRQRPDPAVILEEMVPILANRENSNPDEGLEFPDYFWELQSMFDIDPSTEKLDASRDSVRLLQGAIGYLDEKKHKGDIEKLYSSSSLDTVLFRQRHASPLYIEPGWQDEHHHGSDGGIDINWSPVTEGMRGSQKDSLMTGENTRSNLTDSQEISLSRTDKQRHFQSPINTDSTKEGVAETSLKSESHKSPIQPARGHNMEKDVMVSSPPITKARIDIDQKRVIPLSQTTDLPRPFSGSLGSLSAFMQTRCQRNKRQRLDNESRFFSLPKNNNKLEEVDTEIVSRESEASSKLSSSPPLPMRDGQSLPQFPGSALKSIATPLTLILSTHLLRAESALVRSLEHLSCSQPVRLIFRDVTHSSPLKGATSSKSKVVEEADLIVSPTTGVILCNSHETTQKYLPGQGSPGIESPLKAKIIRAAPRYEMLYVLIRSPIEMSTATTLSSIRDLTAFCISLDHLCTIKVLLVPTDHVLEWILSIATKHAPLAHETAEGGTAATTSPYLDDDQTEWEVFLRNAGLNPFAAQSVLGMLKTMQFDGSDEMKELSRFVERPSAMRREMFEELVGKRVLERAEKAIEMDWQVDWAVNLNQAD